MRLGPITQKQAQEGSPVITISPRPNPISLDIPKHATNNKDGGSPSELEKTLRSSHSLSSSGTQKPATISTKRKALINQKEVTVTSNISSLISHSKGNDEEMREVTEKPDYSHKVTTQDTPTSNHNTFQREGNRKPQLKLLLKHSDLHL